MKFIANPAFLATIAFLVSVNALEVSSPTHDYYRLAQRELQRDLDKVQQKVESADLRGGDILNYLDLNAETLLEKVQNLHDSLVPLQALSQIRKHCVQKFKVELLTYSVVQKELTVCRTAAQTRVTSLTNAAKASVATANTHTNVNLPSVIATCEKDNANNVTKLEACVLEKVDYYTTQVQNYLNAGDKNLVASICTLNDLMRDALICSSKTEQRTLIIIGQVLDAIDECVTQSQGVCECPAPATNPKRISSISEIILGQDSQDEK